MKVLSLKLFDALVDLVSRASAMNKFDSLVEHVYWLDENRDDLTRWLAADVTLSREADRDAAIDATLAHLTSKYDIPAGPQGAPMEPAGDLNAVAGEIGSAQGPEEGAEDCAPWSNDAPGLPVAGGSPSIPEPAPAPEPEPEPEPEPVVAPDPVAGRRANVARSWTDAEDRRAWDLRKRGMTAAMIARELGRPVEGTGWRLRNVLPAKMAGMEQPSRSPDPVTPAPVQAPQPLPAWHRDINAELNALGYKSPWSAALDLDLVERLARGEKLPVIALDFGIDVSAAKARWTALTPNGVSLKFQEQLLTVLRARAAKV